MANANLAIRSLEQNYNNSPLRDDHTHIQNNSQIHQPRSVTSQNQANSQRYSNQLGVGNALCVPGAQQHGNIHHPGTHHPWNTGDVEDTGTGEYPAQLTAPLPDGRTDQRSELSSFNTESDHISHSKSKSNARGSSHRNTQHQVTKCWPEYIKRGIHAGQPSNPDDLSSNPRTEQLAGHQFRKSKDVIHVSQDCYPKSNVPASSQSYPNYPKSNNMTVNFPSSNYPDIPYAVQSFPVADYPRREFPINSFPSPSFPGSMFPLSGFPETRIPFSSFPDNTIPHVSYPEDSFPHAGN